MGGTGTFVAGEDVGYDLVDPFPRLLQKDWLAGEYKVDQTNSRSTRHLHVRNRSHDIWVTVCT